ncbi:hypothetical protein H0H92_008540 [Tricholoma furcatifolium]|nr:hypothetical protein H0H92_008540 [Tricholoma furcatifolium]
MTNYWEPGTEYGYGSIVTYEGVEYRIIQPHRSQSDWAPPVTPALWGRVHHEGEGHHHQHHEHEKPQYDQSNNQHPYAQGQHPYDQGSNNPGQNPGQNPQHHEPWYDDKKVLIGGGIAAGLLGVAGVYLANKHHEHQNDDRHTAWVNEARARTEQFHREGPTGPTTWLLTQGKNFPQYAIEVGQQRSFPVFISRVYWDGGKLACKPEIGAASGAFDKGAAVIGYKHKEFHVDVYEVLVGNTRALRWVPVHGKVNVGALNARPVEGGHEDNGTPLFIAKAMHHGSYYPGKASATLDGAYIPIDGTEKNFKDFEILCYA